METRNYLPFPNASYRCRDNRKRPLLVAVAKGTFKIEDGKVLKPVQEQKPVLPKDTYFGEPGASSILRPSDFVPAKPRTDVFVNALAHAPGGKPQAQWLAEVQVGIHTAAYKILGRRNWVYSGAESRWMLEDPKPVPTVPLRYEQAYGGRGEVDGEEKVFGKNPLGTGFVAPAHPSDGDKVKAPQIEMPGYPVTELGGDYLPAGLCATYEDWGLHSDDAPYAACNRAHPSLMFPGKVPADAWVTLTNLSPEGRLSFGLPPYQMINLVRYVDGGMLPGAMVLDTIAIDVPNMEVQLTWRLPISLNSEVRVLEFRMEQNAEKNAS
ncbi:DUF2169 family type VI secretion system accessory protein [Acanthopleuribacter pedis]|uniref:DUF2169 domain-containing protein n=1 Tax=Acanthopleuribacter pedis TaxID=442870 RepID=A0A8J7QI63_9BACT|nr:DUF2169 domain-containing protein [Acanthopleuribacter pedis]MBO1317376.1 DUF2169 domain-containing protein [Acanthopleuribacter pedis]MBO1318683.1 DUF2169 domain-containing protein [Acanthopleuribacter pedis]